MLSRKRLLQLHYRNHDRFSRWCEFQLLFLLAAAVLPIHTPLTAWVFIGLCIMLLAITVYWAIVLHHCDHVLELTP